jgi:tellurite resistance protein
MKGNESWGDEQKIASRGDAEPPRGQSDSPLPFIQKKERARVISSTKGTEIRNQPHPCPSAIRAIRRSNHPHPCPLPAYRERGKGVLLLTSLAFLLVLLPSICHARAGGGEGYSGGGDGGGGGFGGGGGGGHGGGLILYLLIRLIFEYPVIGIPLLLLIIYLFYQGSQRGNNFYQGNVIRRAGPIIDQQRISNTLELIRRHDPAFSEPAFCQRVTAAFLRIQQAWMDQNLQAVRAFISDGVYERFSLQFAEQKELGYRDVMENVALRQVRIVDVRSAGVFDEMSVRISAEAADYRIGLNDRRYISGSRAVEPFVEIWSFLRRRGAVTDLSKTGLIEGTCPNCGAPIEMNESANCAQCKAVLRSGEYDWVLSEITQDIEWDRGTSRNIPGLDRLQQQDPGFDALALEDRASVVFWRRAAADRIGKVDPLRKMASEDFCQAYAAALNESAGGARRAIRDCAVGSVSMVGFLGPDSDSPFERALVEIRWSGQGGNGTIIGRTLFVLGREAGSQTDSQKSISSAHCPNCGAPESSAASNACEYCSTTLNDGKHGWILLEVAGMSTPRARQLLSGLDEEPLIATAAGGTLGQLRTSSDAGLLAWAVKEAVADGQVDPRERYVLEGIAGQRGVAKDRLEAMIDAARRGELDVPEPGNRTEAEAWMSAMATIALADGKLTRGEFDLLQMLGNKFNIGEYDIKMLLKRIRAEQFAEATAVLRGDNS